jgi:hypothetical protein
LTTADDPGLTQVGLRVGDRVRFRRADGKRWHEATVRKRERDGSIAVHETMGGARSIPIDRLEVLRPGRRGRSTWRSVAELAAHDEQLGLW